MRSRTARAAGAHGIDLPCKNCHLVIVPDDQTETGYSHQFQRIVFLRRITNEGSRAGRTKYRESLTISPWLQIVVGNHSSETVLFQPMIEMCVIQVPRNHL